MKQAIFTQQAPSPNGTYSQAVKVGDWIFLSGQIAKHPITDQLILDNFQAEARQVFDNLCAVAEAAGGNLHHIVKLTVFLTDLANFQVVNTMMQSYFKEPYPARSTIQVAGLPAGAHIEVEAIMCLSG